jgi:hypothetical protein
MVSKYNEIREKFDETWKKYNALGLELERLKVAMHEEALKELLEHNLLSSVDWTLGRRYQDNAVCLIGDTKKIKDKPAYARLEKLFHTDYHCQTNISFNARLRWDDGELTLNFDSLEQLHSFCKEYSFKVNTNAIRESIDENLEKISSLTTKVEQQRKYLLELENHT